MNGIELIQQWMKQAGISSKALENKGRLCSFLFDQQLPVSIEAPSYSDDLFITIEIIPTGTGNIRRKRLEAAMKLNAYALETRGSVLGWDEIGERIILSYRATIANISVDMLDAMLANLIEISVPIKDALMMEKETQAKEKMAGGFDNMFQPIIP